MKRSSLFTVAFSAWLLLIGDPAFAQLPGGVDEFRSCHENVLGTSLEIRVGRVNQETGEQIESRVLLEIERLGKVFSTYSADSELSRFNRLPAGQSMALSADFARLLGESDFWRLKTGSAFHPGAESLYEIWKKAARQERLPNQAELLASSQLLTSPTWQLNPERSVTNLGNYRIGLNAIAEGYILDRVFEVVQKEFAPSSLMINLGGEVRGSDHSFHAAIRNPLETARNAKPLLTVELKNEAIATSGGYHRFLEIDGQKYSHLIDPRTGEPVKHMLSATVVAPEATTADVLATAFSVLSANESLELADSIENVAVLLVDAQGKSWGNLNWTRRFGPLPAPLELTSPTSAIGPASREDDKELVVNFEINQPGGGNRYRRPYIAVWVEDKDGYPVKTLALWVQSTGPGPKWIPDLKKWYKADGLRKLAEETDLVATMSEATHKPGKYELAWDGKDSSGNQVEAGEYTLYIEAAREHGTYQLIKQTIKLGVEDFQYEPKGNVEIKSAEILYRSSKQRQ